MSKPLCIIIGMASRIGLNVAKKFAKEGYDIAMIGRTRFLLEKYQKKLADAGIVSYPYVAEGDSLASLEAAFDAIFQDLGDPDVLVYNESVISTGFATTIEGEELMADLRTNVVGALVSANKVIPSMKRRQKGTILFTGGEFAISPDPEYASLTVGNAATRNLTIALAKELESDGIHVATVTVHGLAKVQTMFDPTGVKFEPAEIADKFYELHTQPKGQFATEVVYK